MVLKFIFCAIVVNSMYYIFVKMYEDWNLCDLNKTFWQIMCIFFFALQAKDPWETTPEEKMSLALHHKAKGTDCFKVELPLRLNFNWHTCISPATHTCIAILAFMNLICLHYHCVLRIVPTWLNYILNSVHVFISQTLTIWRNFLGLMMPSAKGTHRLGQSSSEGMG